LDKSNIYKLINEQCKKLIMSGGESYEGWK
jgi:hypothetical protein